MLLSRRVLLAGATAASSSGPRRLLGAGTCPAPGPLLAKARAFERMAHKAALARSFYVALADADEASAAEALSELREFDDEDASALVTAMVTDARMTRMRNWCSNA